MIEDRPKTIRLVAWMNIVMGVLAVLCIFLARDRQVAIWSVVTPGLGLILWGGVEAWAARGRQLAGTKVLAMFMAVLGIVIGGSSFLTEDAGLFRAFTIVLGILVFAVSLTDAIVAPDEDRRAEFEPRTPDDLAPPPIH